MSNVKAVFGQTFSMSRPDLAQKWRFSGKYWFCGREKHMFAQTTSFDVFCVKIRAGLLALGDRKYPPPSHKNSRVNFGPDGGAKSRMRGKETPDPIWITCCGMVGIPDLITSTNFGDDQVMGFGVARGPILPFPLTLIVFLITPSHYRVSM